MLSTSAKTTHSSATAPSPSFTELLNFSSATRARVSFNEKLERKGCELGANLATTTLVLLGD